MQNFTSGSSRESSGSSSRAGNYNAYHKLAFAVAEVWGSAILRLSLEFEVLIVLILKLAIYSQGQQKKFNYSAPMRDIELKFLG